MKPADTQKHGFDIIGLYGKEDQITGRDVFGRVCRIDAINVKTAASTFDAQPVLLHGLKMRPSRNIGDVMTFLLQPSAEEAPKRTSPVDDYPHGCGPRKENGSTRKSRSVSRTYDTDLAAT